MQKIKITCDSTCDLSPELYEKYDISAIPLGVTLGDDFHHDGVDVTAQEIFSFVDKTGVLPKTSAISMGEYTDFFKPYLDAGYAIIHINISSDFSICYQNACLAATSIPSTAATSPLALAIWPSARRRWPSRAWTRKPSRRSLPSCRAGWIPASSCRPWNI